MHQRSLCVFKGEVFKAPDTDNKVDAADETNFCSLSSPGLELFEAEMLIFYEIRFKVKTLYFIPSHTETHLPFFLPTVHSLLKSRTVSLESTLTSFPHGRPLL